MILIGPRQLESPRGHAITVGNNGNFNLYEVRLRIQVLRLTEDKTFGEMSQQKDVLQADLGTIGPNRWQLTNLRLDVPDQGGRYLVDFSDRGGQTHGEVSCAKVGSIMECTPTMATRNPY